MGGAEHDLPDRPERETGKRDRLETGSEELWPVSSEPLPPGPASKVWPADETHKPTDDRSDD